MVYSNLINHYRWYLHPEELFFECLNEWEGVYLLAGRWAERNPNFSLPTGLFITDHLVKGMDNIYSNHFVRKADGQYIRRIKLPESEEIRELLIEPNHYLMRNPSL